MTYEELLDKYQDWLDHPGCAVEEAVIEEVLHDLKRMKP